MTDITRDTAALRHRNRVFRSKLLNTARHGGSIVPVMLCDVISNETENGPSEDTAITAMEGLRGMAMMALTDGIYRLRFNAWLSGQTSTVALRGLYADANNAPYLKSLAVSNAVDTIDTAKLHVRQAQEELQSRSPVAQMAVGLGANIFRVLFEEDDRYATGFCAASEMMMTVAELARFQEIEAEARAARDAEPYREMAP